MKLYAPIPKWRLLLWISFGVSLLGAFTMTHLPPRRVPDFHVNDKILHMVGFALLAALLATCLFIARGGIAVRLALVLLPLAGYAAIDELTQPFFGRMCEFDDWMSDISGAALASVLMELLFWAIRRREPAND